MNENEKRNNVYRFVDSPPTPNNEPHVGHGRNIVYKDFFMKLEFLMGKKIETRPGWDVHGTPIEVAVQKERGIKSREEIEQIGLEKFEQMCKEHATRYEEVWKDLYENLLLRLVNAEKIVEKPLSDYVEGETVIIPKDIPEDYKVAAELARRLRLMRKEMGFQIGEQVVIKILPLPPLKEWIEKRVDAQIIEGEGEELVRVADKEFKVSIRKCEDCNLRYNPRRHESV